MISRIDKILIDWFFNINFTKKKKNSLRVNICYSYKYSGGAHGHTTLFTNARYFAQLWLIGRWRVESQKQVLHRRWQK